MKIITSALFGMLAAPAFATTLLTDNFDSGSASADWYRKVGVTVTAGGPTGSTNFLNVTGSTNAANGLGDQIGGATNFVIDYYFRLRDDSSNRQFNMSVSTASYTPSPGDGTINLRYQGGNSGAWAVYNGAWQPLGSLGSVTAETWYHMQITGTNWGTASAAYTIQISDAGGSAFTKTTAALTMIQAGSITGPFLYNGTTSFSGLAQSFIFTTAYGAVSPANPGFDVDNVTVTGDLVPEPSAVLLSGTAALFLTRRRK